MERKCLKLIAFFSSLILLFSVIAVVAITPSSVAEGKIVLVEISGTENVSILNEFEAEILETYERHVLLRAKNDEIELMSARGMHVDSLPGRTMIYAGGERFDFTEGEPDIPAALRVDKYEPGTEGQYIVHMLGPIASHWRTTLESMDVQVLNYISNHAYRVRMTPETAQNVEELYFVDWVGIYHPYYKLQPGLEPGLIELGLINNAAHESVSEVINTINAHSNNLDKQRTTPSAEVRGTGNVHLYTELTGGGYIVLADVCSEQALYELAMINDVDYIFPYIEPELHDEVATQIIGGGCYFFDDEDGNPDTAYRLHGLFGSYMNQLGYTGKGVVTAVADTGISDGVIGGGHTDFQGRVIGGYTYTDDGSWEDNHGHGTHCAGSVGGNTHDGTGNTFYNDYYSGQGSAPDTELYAVRIFDSGASWVGPGDIYDMVQVAKDNANAYVHTNSWGAAVGGSYDSRTSRFDKAVRGEDMVITTSAGNSGPGDVTIGAPATGKNVITVGATNNHPSNPEDVASFSSRGWTEDNRIKPDVQAPGNNIYSTRHDGDGYRPMSGTSMSNPAVAGAAAVLVEWYEVNHGYRPSPAMVKALLINTANPIDGNTRGDIPNQDEGWGMVDISKLERPLTDPIPFFLEDQSHVFTDSLQWNEHVVMVDRENESLKFSLVWTDKEAPPATGGHRSLINDLNLRVESPSGVTYRGNAFSEGWTQAGADTISDFDNNGDGWDDTNNVENVYIPSDEVEMGAYTIQIEAREIADDAVGLGYNSQDYVLVAYNAIDDIPGNPPQVIVISPDGGEVVNARDEEYITWTTTEGDDAIDRIDISLSTDNGISWTNIVRGIDDSGSYLWSIPNANSDECLIRVSAIDIFGRRGYGISDDVFEIIGVPPEQPPFSVVEHASAPYIEVFDDFSDGDYTTDPEWTVYDGYWDASDGYLQGHGSISTPAHMDGYDISAYGRWEYDFQFTEVEEHGNWQGIRNFFIQIDNPDSRYSSGYYVIVIGEIGGSGGEINLWRFDDGDIHPGIIIGAYWESDTDIHTLAIERDENNIFTIYLDDERLGTGTDDTYTTNDYLGFRHNANPSGGDDHIIHEVRVQVTEEGDRDNLLSWDASPSDADGEVSHYDIYRSESSSGPWDGSTLIDSVQADGSERYEYYDLEKGMLDDIYWWYVVRAIGKNGLEEYNEAAIQEPGDSGIDPPSITITSPDGSDRWHANTQEYITWSTTAGDNPTDWVNLWYSQDAGETWDTITAVDDTGSYTWTIPNNHTSEAQVRARVVDTQGRWSEDVSDLFEIIGVSPSPPQNLAVDHYDFAEDWYYKYNAAHRVEPDHGTIGTNMAFYLGMRVELPSGEATNIAYYYDATSHGPYVIRGTIYTDGPGGTEPGTLLGHTDVITTDGGVQEWIEIPFTSPVSTDAGHYWIVMECLGSQNNWFLYRRFSFVEDGGWESRDEGATWDEVTSTWPLEVFVEEHDEDGDDDNMIIWDPSPDESIDEVSHYNLYRSENPGGPWDGSNYLSSVAVGEEYVYYDLERGMLDDIYWWYVVRAVGLNGLEEQNTNAVQEPGGETTTFDIPLTAGGDADGWNFVSFNLMPVDTSLEAILDDVAGNYDRVMYFDASSGEWSSYVPGRDGRFNNLGKWNHRMGIWIRATIGDTLTIEGVQPVSTDITLYPGWNMVGLPSGSSGNHGLPGEIDRLGYFDGTAEYNLAYSFDPGTFVFEPGKGYWIHNPGDTAVVWTVEY